MAPSRTLTSLPFKLDLPSFQGRSDEDAQAWLDKVDTYFLLFPLLSGFQRMILAATRLEGAAAVFWTDFRLQPTFANLELDVDAYSKFQTAFKARFLPHGWEQHLYDQFAATQHRTTVEQFAARLQHIAAQLKLGDRELRQKFISSLRPYFQERVRCQVPTTFTEAVQVAKALEVLAPSSHLKPRASVTRSTIPSATRFKRSPPEVTATPFAGKCHTCGKVGHKASDCWVSKRARINAVSATLPHMRTGKSGPGQR